MQSAYRPRHSTETALLGMVDNILAALDNSEITALTLLDLSSAFDTIDHQILIQRLQTVFGFRDNVLSWVQSYLSARTQSVAVNGMCSEPSTLKFGVPQGSVLGPVLFIMYTQPLSAVVNSFSVDHASYADDTQLHDHCSLSDVNSMLLNLERCISGVTSWMIANKLSLNAEKTEAVLISSPRKSVSTTLPQDIHVDGARIEFTSSVKSLGVTLDNTLSMSTHVLNVCRAAYMELRRIASIRHFLSTEAAKTLVCSLVLSRLDYCNCLLSGSPQYLIDRLQRVQNNAARLVLRARRSDHATPLLQSLHWLPISARIQYKISTLTYTSLFDSGPLYLSTLIHTYTPTRTLRSSTDTRTLTVPPFRTKSFGYRRFSYQSPYNWNSLPPKVRHSKSSPTFKSALKNHLFKTSFM